MKCSQFLKLLKSDGWVVKTQKGSHLKMVHSIKKGVIIFPNHGSAELGKVLEKSLRKQAGLE